MITVSDSRAKGSGDDRAVDLWARLRQRQLEAARRGRIAESAHYAELAQRTGLGLWRREEGRSS